MAEKGEKSDSAKREEKILAFWKENHIFEKSQLKPAPKGEFVFYDGPPFATGLPHYGSLLSSIIKDVIPRYKTMQGFHVRRRWGWDCHGLPIENMIEKELGLKSKKEILALGIDNFNKACRSAVLRYAHEWKQYIDRVGRWVEFDNAYMTMDNTFIESVWWFLKENYKKGLLYEGRKVLLYCPHCETPLAKAEIAQDNSYKDVTEESVYVKFRVSKDKSLFKKGDYLLAWTTTPWTLPGNVALAVSNKEDYIILESKIAHERFVLASRLVEKVFGGNWEGEYREQANLSGQDLVGLEYEPLFSIPKVVEEQGENTHTVLSADFVTTEEGTGIVHTAVIYGEDDYQLGLEKNLPMVPLLDAGGHFNNDAPKLIQGHYFKKAEKLIKEDLEKRGLLFKREMYTHSYPHCHRCGTALIYSALTSWFLNIQKIKHRMLTTNEDINWYPEHIKHGRYQNILENAPDWTISRNRFWASPMPIWRHPKTNELTVIGSLEELKNKTQKSRNTYFIMRHGESESNAANTVSSQVNDQNSLTEKGKEQVKEGIKALKKEEFDVIFSSPLSRAKETAEIVCGKIGFSPQNIVVDERIREISFGVLNGKSRDEYWNYFKSPQERFDSAPEGAETVYDVRNRVGEFLYDIESKYEGKDILIVAHEDVLWLMSGVAHGADKNGLFELKGTTDDYIKNGEGRELMFIPLPHNENYELDLHRPYIDGVTLLADDGEALVRVPEVIDGWVESGSMPFAEYHYPFENKETFEQRFPGDFIAEYIAQTRTWFYYMHAVGVLQFGKASFKNVVTTGNILAEDGSKMSKSKGNYTDPLINLDKFGADTLRYYLMSSVVMQAEDTRFVDDELREVHNRVINILRNVNAFYLLYASSAPLPENTSEHILDKWILARLKQLILSVTSGLDKYDVVRATRPIRDFVEDFSTWYIRRSRERVKSEDAEDKKRALATTRYILREFSKAIAPIVPFIADEIYRGVKTEQDPESVHLCIWPHVSKSLLAKIQDLVMHDSKTTLLLSTMADVRKVVSLALEARSKEGIKVRQPLSMLRVGINFTEEYKTLIQDEVNVKDVVYDKTLKQEEVKLDTTLTKELKEEGVIRDFIRVVQDLRKDMGLTPDDMVILKVYTQTGKELLERYRKEIQGKILAKDIIFGTERGSEIILAEHKLSVSLEKISP